jgi:hypothetical protein
MVNFTGGAFGGRAARRHVGKVHQR